MPMPIQHTDTFQLGESIAELAAHLDAASHEYLTRLHRFDTAGGWNLANAKSCAHWLSWRCGLDPVTAREHVRVAAALADLPVIDAAFSRGEISYSKVRAMVPVANSENEAQLLLIARHTTGAQLQKICRGADAVAGAKTPPIERRGVWTRPSPNGLVRVQADLLPDEAGIVMKAIEQMRAASPEPPAAGQRLASRADALVSTARALLQPGGLESLARPTTPVELMIELGPQSLAEGWAPRLADGTVLAAATLRRLACDGGVVIVATDEAGNALDVGRRTRVWPSALRRALLRRDRHCRFPGCTHDRWLDGHHLDPWLEGGETSLGRGLMCCRPHHIRLHEGGWTVALVGDELVFTDPHGREYRSVPPPPELPADPVAAIAGEAEAQGKEIDAKTNLPRWDGEPIDYVACIDSVTCQSAEV